MSLESTDFDNMCRICTKIFVTLTDLLQINQDGITNLEKLKTCFNIEIKTDDFYPKSICKACQRKLDICYDFRNLLFSSQEKFNKFEEEQILNNEEFLNEIATTKLKKEDNKNDVIFEKQEYMETNEEYLENEETEEDIRYYLVVEEDCLSENISNSNFSNPITSNENNEIDESIKKYLITETNKEKQMKPRRKQMNRITKVKSENTESNKIHKCDYCRKRFISIQRLKSHMRRLHTKIYLDQCKVFCPKCDMKFEHVRNLKRHLVYHETHTSYFGCSFCSKKLYSKKSWRLHVKGHNKAINEICKICNKNLETSVRKMYHTEMHRSKEIFANKTFYSCQTCDLNFYNFVDLKEHNSDVHSIVLKCEDVVEKTIESDEMIENKETIENQQTIESKETIEKEETNENCKKINGASPVIFKCNICLKLYLDLNDLNFHVNNCFKNLERPKPFMCDVCGKCFTFAWMLTNHKAGHSNNRKFICDVCGQRFKWHNDLTNHKKRIHEKFKPYVCKYCGKRCSTSAMLKVHCRSHSKERPFKCTVCQAQFRQNCSLKEHMFKHEGMQELSCNVCNKIYKTPLRLRTHMKRHSVPKKLYSCEQCEKVFTEKSTIRKHKIKMHNDFNNYASDNDFLTD